MGVVVAIAVVFIALVLLFSSGSSAKDLTGDDIVRGGPEHAQAAEQKAQKARADAIAAHDAIFRNRPSDGNGPS